MLTTLYKAAQAAGLKNTQAAYNHSSPLWQASFVDKDGQRKIESDVVAKLIVDGKVAKSTDKDNGKAAILAAVEKLRADRASDKAAK